MTGTSSIISYEAVRILRLMYNVAITVINSTLRDVLNVKPNPVIVFDSDIFRRLNVCKSYESIKFLIFTFSGNSKILRRLFLEYGGT